jgi:hypothetical protein
MRAVLGFLVAPLAPAIGAWLLSLAPSITGVSQPGSLFALSLLYGYPLAALFGVPTYFYFRHKNWLRLWQVVAAGLAIGSIVPIALVSLLVAYNFSERSLIAAIEAGFRDMGALIPFGAAVGALCASTFWLLALARPNKRSQAASPGAA